MKLPAHRSEATMLRRALHGNAGFSAVCGMLLVIFDARIAALITDPGYALWPLGVMLLGFSALLVWLSTRAIIASAWISFVIVADLAWVLGTIVLLTGWHGMLTAAGFWILAAIGILVFVFAELQWVGLRRLERAVTNR